MGRARSIGFNPRPPRKVGATVCRGPGATDLSRFNPRPPRKVGATVALDASSEGEDVSILAHPERWALLDGAQGVSGHLPVSILAHPERWALPFGLGKVYQAIVFQSSPTPKGGRYVPDPLNRHGFFGVSILAHPERWALPHDPC